MKEFKIIEVPKSNFKKLFETDFSRVEALLAQRSAEGWEVVSVCPNEYVGNWAGGILITLQRERP